MYNEFDWSSLTASELLEKATDFTKKAYSNSMSALAFFERTIETASEQSNLKEEVSALLEKAQRVNNALAELQREVDTVRQELSRN